MSNVNNYRLRKTGTIIGKSTNHTLKAAEKPAINRAVFCIANVEINQKVDDIYNHCKKLGVKAISCFDITASNRVARAFKLSIDIKDIKYITDVNSWPTGVTVRSWKSKGNDTVVMTSSDVEDDVTDVMNQSGACTKEVESAQPGDTDETQVTRYNKFYKMDTDQITKIRVGMETNTAFNPSDVLSEGTSENTSENTSNANNATLNPSACWADEEVNDLVRINADLLSAPEFVAMTNTSNHMEDINAGSLGVGTQGGSRLLPISPVDCVQLMDDRIITAFEPTVPSKASSTNTIITTIDQNGGKKQ